MAENKVNFGLKNVHYAPITVGPTGALTYGTITPIPGAVELSLEPRGDMSEFYADDILYYVTGANQGYDGTLTIANIPEQFAIDCLGEERGANGLMTEKVTAKGRNFALLFEFDGDVKETKHILYNCSASRPSLGSSTKTNATEPYTNELTFVAMARESDLAVKTKTTSTTNNGVHTSWYLRLDGIHNTIDKATETFDLKSGVANNNAKSFAITTTKTAGALLNIDKVLINGVDTPKRSANSQTDDQWSFNTANKNFVLGKPYLEKLGIGDYKVELQTTDGNYLEIALKVVQSA